MEAALSLLEKIENGMTSIIFLGDFYKIFLK